MPKFSNDYRMSNKIRSEDILRALDKTPTSNAKCMD